MPARAESQEQSSANSGEPHSVSIGRVRLAGVDVFESLPGCEQLVQQDGESNTSVEEIQLYVRFSLSISHPFGDGNLYSVFRCLFTILTNLM